MTHPVRNFTFDGIYDSILKGAASSSFIELPIPFDKFGWFYPESFYSIFILTLLVVLLFKLKIFSVLNLLLNPKNNKETYYMQEFCTIYFKTRTINPISVNGIICLMGSNWPQWNKSHMSLKSIICIRNMFSHCYNSVNGISLTLA